MDTKNSKEMFGHSAAFHEQHLALFDAYITNELDEDERAQVDEHLSGCQECQQLFVEVTRFRHQIGMLIETPPPLAPEREQVYASQITHFVMSGLEHEKKAGGGEQQVQTRLGLSTTPIRRKKRTGLVSLRIIAALFCLFLLTGLIFTLRHGMDTSISSGKGMGSVPSPIVWTSLPKYMLAQNSAGVFAIKEIEITTLKEFRFYYVVKSSHQGNVHVTAVSVPGSSQGQDVPLSAIIQSLGMIDNYSVGVIRVQYLDRVGQTITLHITLPALGNANWQLSPLKQLITEPHSEGGDFYGFSVDQRIFPEIIWSGPAGSSKQSLVAFFKDSSSAHYIFLQVDYLGKIRTITREECIQMGGEQNCH